MDPVLQEFLRSRQWERAFSRDNVESGLGLVSAGAVPPGFHIEDHGKKLVVQGLVHGDHPPHGYQAEVIAEKDLHLGRVTMRSSCTCGARLFCAHRYALIFAATEELEAEDWRTTRSMPMEVRQWLEDLARVAAADVPPETNTQRVYYTLFNHPDHGPVICPRQGLLGQDGLPTGQWKPVDLHHQAENGRLRQEDVAFQHALAAMATRTLTGPPATPAHELNGPGSSQLLRQLLESGRLFLVSRANDPKPRLLVAGAPTQLALGWDESESGRVMPVVVLEHRGLFPLLFDIPWCLDEENATLHPLAGKVTPGLHAQWVMGPSMGPEDTDLAARTISAMPVALPVPAADTLEHVHPESFTPVLLCRRVRPQDGTRLELPAGGAVLAIPVFRYGPGREFSPLRPFDEALGKIHTKEKLFVIHRLKEAEEKALGRLEQSGLRPVDGGYGLYQLGSRFAGAVFPETASLQDPLAWAMWKTSPEARELLASGWVLEEPAEPGVKVIEIPVGQLHLDPFEKDGIDWFAFDLGVEVDGERVSLLPALATAMESHGDALLDVEAGDDDQLALALDDGSNRIIHFPLRRFIGMARHVIELFGAIPRPGARLHLMQAAEITARGDEDIVGPAPEETGRLRRLGRNLREPGARVSVPVPNGVQATLRPYQEEGFQWLQFLARHDLNGILADDMGLGKTLQTITHIAAEKELGHHGGHPTLVVAPTSVVGNWIEEIRRFAPHLRVLRLHGAARHQHFDSISSADVVVTSYALLQRDADALADRRFHLVVLDEAQYIKNPSTKAAQSACKLNSKHRLALSGTPMENHLGELWSLMRFLMPGLLGSSEEFRRLYRTPIERQTDVNRQCLLNRKVGPLILRRTKDLVAKDLPPKTEITQLIDLHSEQADLYESVRAALDARVREAIASRGLAKSHLLVLDAMLKLRQICCHPGLLETSVAAAAGSAKLDHLMDLLVSLGESGRRVLVFSQFTAMLARIEDRLDGEGIRYLKLTGSTQNRAELVREFQEGDVPVFLISLKAGGTGLNLTAADTVIHYDPWWNPAVENQASDRAHRIGQTKPVFIHRLICRGTIEERIQELQAKKAGMVDALLSGSTESFSLDADTIRNLMAPLEENA